MSAVRAAILTGEHFTPPHTQSVAYYTLQSVIQHRLTRAEISPAPPSGISCWNASAPAWIWSSYQTK